MQLGELIEDRITKSVNVSKVADFISTRRRMAECFNLDAREEKNIEVLMNLNFVRDTREYYCVRVELNMTQGNAREPKYLYKTDGTFFLFFFGLAGSGKLMEKFLLVVRRD